MEYIGNIISFYHHLRIIEMKSTLEIKLPWEMVWMESVEDFMKIIKESLPSYHDLQGHDRTRVIVPKRKDGAIDSR